jgi:hypothetical protein
LHDPVTQEFVNIGVAVYSAEAQFLRVTCTTHYARITRMFEKIDGTRFRQLTRYIQDRINDMGQRMSNDLPFEPGQAIETLLARVLPPDDSSMQFSPAGVGMSANLEKALADLFDRYVERYTVSTETPRREDEDIWRTFRQTLEQRDVVVPMEPKKIVAPNYEYEFQHAWKNGRWHVYEPVSFDLVEGPSIVDKANRWLGRATSLMDSAEDFQMYLLLGEPQDARLQPDFQKAQNILRKMPGKTRLVRESDAERFAEELEREVREHHG